MLKYPEREGIKDLGYKLKDGDTRYNKGKNTHFNSMLVPLAKGRQSRPQAMMINERTNSIRLTTLYQVLYTCYVGKFHNSEVGLIMFILHLY